MIYVPAARMFYSAAPFRGQWVIHEPTYRSGLAEVAIPVHPRSSIVEDLKRANVIGFSDDVWILPEDACYIVTTGFCAGCEQMTLKESNLPLCPLCRGNDD